MDRPCGPGPAFLKVIHDREPRDDRGFMRLDRHLVQPGPNRRHVRTRYGGCLSHFWADVDDVVVVGVAVMWTRARRDALGSWCAAQTNAYVTVIAVDGDMVLA